MDLSFPHIPYLLSLAYNKKISMVPN